jgi:hypothetical protein
MWDADRIWMPRVLSGERDVRLVFHYDADDRVRAFETYDGACSLSVPERLL